MSKQKIKSLILIVLIGSACLLYLIFFKTSTQHPDSTTSATSHTPMNTPVNSAPSSTTWASQSQQDTEINCQIQINSTNTLRTTEQTRDCFEYFLSQSGEKPFPQIQKDFKAFIQANYPDPAQGQILELWGRYLKYRQAAAELTPNAIHQNDSRYFQQLFLQNQALKKRYFSIAEIEALFKHEDDYHRYTLQRLEIINNDQLSTAEKAQQLKRLTEQLPSDLHANLKQLSQLDDLQRLSAEIKARGGSAAELQQMRQQLVGVEATMRLERLDQQRRLWKQQVEQYLTEKDIISQSNLSPSAKQKAIQQLRDRHFISPQQQLRLKSYETAHQQGQALDFAE